MDKRVLALYDNIYKGNELTSLDTPFVCAAQRHNYVEGRLSLTGFRIMRDLSIKYNKGDQACEEGRQAVNAGDWGKFAATIESFANDLLLSTDDMSIFSLLLISDLMELYVSIYDELRSTCSSGLEFAARMYKANPVYINNKVRNIDSLLKDINEENTGLR